MTLVLERGARIPEKTTSEELVQNAALCIAVVEELTPAEYYLLGAARAALTPTITLTLNSDYVFDPIIPREYQPRPVAPNDSESLLNILDVEIATFEEDYLDLKEEAQIRRYKKFRDSILRSHRREGVYSDGEREQIVNYIENAEIDRSKDKINVGNVVGPVNIKSRLEHVTQTVQQAAGWTEDRRAEPTKLLAELQAGLEQVTEIRPEDADRVLKTAELVIVEATKAKPDRSFLSITTEGLKQAAKAVADIAPTVLAVAGKVAAFVAGLT